MENKVSHIGKVLSHEQSAASVAIRSAHSIMVPALKRLKTEYEKFPELGAFNQAVLQDIIDNGHHTIEEKMLSFANKDLAKFTTRTMVDIFLQNVKDSLKDLKAEIKSFLLSTATARDSTGMYRIELELSDISIAGSDILIDEKAIAERYIYRITNEAQCQIYSKAVQIKEDLHALRELLGQSGYDLMWSGLISPFKTNSIFDEDVKGNIHINTAALAGLG